MSVLPLTIRLFGPLRVCVSGEPLPRVRTRSVEWLLALLTLRHGRTVSRAWLAGTLWPDSSESRALQNLREDLVRLRKALGPEAARIQSPARDSLRLDLADAAVDVLQFDAAIEAGDDESLRRAVEVYTGPLLEGCVEEWVLVERETRAEQCLRSLEALAERAEGRGEHGEAIAYLRRAEAFDPLRDSLQRGLMRILAASGDHPAALLTYREHRLRLHREMNLEPDAETQALFRRLREEARRQAARGLGREQAIENTEAKPGGRESTSLPPSLSGPAVSPGARVLPTPITALIGREQETREIAARIRATRLVTLVGGGGVGKTRLALQVATELTKGYPGRVAFVELAPLADPALLPAFVSGSLGLREAAGPAPASGMPALTRWLEREPTLLVLDNCEHLVSDVAELARTLLQACPALRLLATSRQRLGLTGEVVWRVPSLPAPDPEQLPGEAASTVEHVLQFPAAQLFVERAGMARPGFRLRQREEALAVARICQRLDGVPLALELAAARVTVLPVAQIAARLDDRFQLLTGGSRAVLARHRTLRALIDWSYDSLPAPEAALLRRLSVFAGGWTLAAAEAVCGGAALDLLDSLEACSLVLVDEGAEGLRYRMLETVREYAGEKLAASGERPAVRNQHRDWYLQLAEQVGAEASDPELSARLTRLEAELDNLRTALAWCQEAADAIPGSAAAEAGLRLADTLYWLRLRYGYPVVDALSLERALVRDCAAPAPLRARAFLRAADLAQSRGRPESAMSYLQSARQGYEEILTLARKEGDRSGAAGAILAIATAMYAMGDLGAAWSCGMEARQHMAELGDRIGLAHSVRVLSDVALARGEFRVARSLLEERLVLSRELGDSGLLIHVLGRMGHLMRDEGDYARAHSLYQESLVLRRELGDRIALAQSLEDLAALAGRERQAERSIRLLGAAEAFCETLGARPPVAVPEEYERTVAEGRAALGEAAFAAAWAEGRAMSIEQAIEYALG
jgi:predicted ATPase/DNA-binding SARP family transcriptional activator